MTDKGVYYIEWVDAISPSDGSWFTEEEAIEWVEASDCIISDVGYIIKETDEYILLASRSSTYSEIAQYGGLFKIPNPWIIKKQKISL